jgi:hypothetical protein
MSMPTSIKEDSASFARSTTPLILIGLIWAAYLVAYLFAQHHGNLGWVLLFVTDNSTILILTVSFFVLWRNTRKINTTNSLLGLFVTSHLFLLIAAIIYIGARYLIHQPHLTSLWSSLNDTFFIGYLLLTFVSFSLILLNIKIDIKKTASIYMPVILGAGLLFGILFYITKWDPNTQLVTMAIWSTSTYAIVEKILEIACISVASFCVVTAKNKGIFYLSLGFLIGIAVEIILAFDILNQEYAIGSVVESGWVLRNLLMLYGLILLSKSKDLSNVRAWLRRRKQAEIIHQEV